MEFTIALDVKAELGEGPIWDAARQRLLFVDIMRGLVHDFDPVSGDDRVLNVHEPVSVVVPSAQGDYIIGTQSGFYRMDPSDGHTTRIALVDTNIVGNRMNDGYVDSRGRFWAGTMSMMGRAHGSLYRLDPDLRVMRMVGGVSVSNGVDWSPDDRFMYYVDTHTGRIDVFDFDADTGNIANRRPLVNVPHTAGHPDGMIVDAEGFLWLALWAGGAIHRYAPDGRLDRAYPTPMSHPTKCAFGGPDLSDLYVTSASIELKADARAAQPHAGSLYRARPGVKGRPAHRFAG